MGSSSWFYAANSGGWSVVGFIAGYLIARRFKEASVDNPKPKDTRPTTRWLGIVVVVLAVFTVGQSAYFSYEQRKTAECQADFNDAFALSLADRAVIAEQDRAALDKMVEDIVRSPQGDELEALQDYLDTTAQNEQERSQNPLPSLPDANCG